jgi:Domain of Unknown Function (DUF1080)
MKPFTASVLAALVLPVAVLAADPFAGRWDITVKAGNSTYPDWLEVTDNGSSLHVRYQPRGGSVRPLSDSKIEGDHLLLNINGNGKQGPTIWELTAHGDSISGVQKSGTRETAELKGVRAPKLDRKMPASWTTPEPLFNGKELTGWEPDNPSINHWVAKSGELVNETKGANLRSTRKFDDFKLHMELNCPQGGNSGVYLRGRYEMQVEYEEHPEDDYHCMGAIYGMVPVSHKLPATPGKWETFDITLVGRRVTIVRNGTTIIDNQEIAGITGGAIDANEGEPGVFYIQGDHTGGMKYRNITISVPKK